MGKKILISVAALAAAVAIIASPYTSVGDAAEAPAGLLADLPGGGGTGP